MAREVVRAALGVNSGKSSSLVAVPDLLFCSVCAVCAGDG